MASAIADRKGKEKGLSTLCSFSFDFSLDLRGCILRLPRLLISSKSRGIFLSTTMIFQKSFSFPPTGKPIILTTCCPLEEEVIRIMCFDSENSIKTCNDEVILMR